MVNTPQSKQYLTSNTSLAAFLVSCEFTLLHIQYDGNSGTFVFEAQDEIEASVLSFTRCEAMGNIVRYQMARDELVDRVKRRLP